VADRQGWADRGRPVRQVAMLQRPREFGECVGSDPGLLAKNSGRRSRWGQADHLTAILGPGRVRARMAVVLPAPAGAIASCSRAPEVHICQTIEACPASRAVPFAASSSSARSTAV
jgi:hypothetical protein